MTIEKGHLVAGFLDGLSLLRMWLKKKLLQRLDQRDVEPVELDDGFSRVVCVVVPGQLRRQNKIAFFHHALLTINRRIGAAPFENEAQSGGGVSVRPGVFSRFHVLKRKLNGVGGGLPLLERRI